MGRWLCAQYSVGDLEAVKTAFTELGNVESRRCTRGGMLEYDIKEEWRFDVLVELPTLDDGLKIQSMYHLEAEELDTSEDLRSATYHFQNTKRWEETGLQCLNRASWRFDCSKPHSFDLTKVLPPIGSRHNTIIFGGIGAIQRLTEEEKSELMELYMSTDPCIEIETMAFYENNLGFTCAWIKDINDRISTNTYFHGSDTSTIAPRFMEEVAVFRALQITLEILEHTQQRGSPVIRIRAGGPTTCRSLAKWLNTGIFDLRSAVASPIVTISHQLMEITTCPILVEWTEHSETFKKKRYRDCDMDDPQEVIGVSRLRFLDFVYARAFAKWGERLARIPLTQEEVKARIKMQFESDERRAITSLRVCGSISSGIFLRLGLTRKIIKEALKRLSYSRPLQVTLCSIICGTRFKFHDNGVLRPTVCQKAGCGMIDSFEHLLDCTGLRLPDPADNPSEDEEEILYSFLEELAFHAYNVNPGFPVPLRTEESGELAIYTNGEDGENSMQSDPAISLDLEFEMDEE